MATFGYRPATITALINFSLSEKWRERQVTHICVSQLCVFPPTLSWNRWLLPELTLDLGSLGSLLLTKPACIRCSANWPFMLCSIWMRKDKIAQVGQRSKLSNHWQAASLTWSVLADRKLSQQYSLSYLAPRRFASSQPYRSVDRSWALYRRETQQQQHSDELFLPGRHWRQSDGHSWSFWTKSFSSCLPSSLYPGRIVNV